MLPLVECRYYRDCCASGEGGKEKHRHYRIGIDGVFLGDVIYTERDCREDYREHPRSKLQTHFLSAAAELFRLRNFARMILV